jgi:catechol 2,3-dioxygenase-like lactoylglutathione lyase family enzyme
VERSYDFIPRRDVQAISHINVVADDIEVAAEFYRAVLGFEQAANADGPMGYPAVDLASFARDAAFDDGRASLDVRFLKHPEVGVHLELFTYHHPKGDQPSTAGRRTIWAAFATWRWKCRTRWRPTRPSARSSRRTGSEAAASRSWARTTSWRHSPRFPYKFFYLIDPWGVQSEMEQGRPFDRAVKGIVG